MLKFNEVLKTDGTGLWSNIPKPVSHSHIELREVNRLLEYGEIRVFFRRETWDPKKDGLIYTDTNWLKEFRAKMELLGFDPLDFSYSEHGMQGDDYVSLDFCGPGAFSRFKRLEKSQ